MLSHPYTSRTYLSLYSSGFCSYSFFVLTSSKIKVYRGLIPICLAHCTVLSARHVLTQFMLLIKLNMVAKAVSYAAARALST